MRCGSVLLNEHCISFNGLRAIMLFEQTELAIWNPVSTGLVVGL